MLTYRYSAYHILIVIALKLVFPFILERLHSYFRSLSWSLSAHIIAFTSTRLFFHHFSLFQQPSFAR